jgi:hypothetical protein
MNYDSKVFKCIQQLSHHRANEVWLKRLGSLWWNQPTQVQVLDLTWAFIFIWIYSKIFLALIF